MILTSAAAGTPNIWKVLAALLLVGVTVFFHLHTAAVALHASACFDALVDSFDGVARAPFAPTLSELISEALEPFHVGGAGVWLWTGAILMTTLPFVAAVWLSQSAASARFWLLLALTWSVIVIAFYIWTFEDFYECDRNGVSLAGFIFPLIIALLSLLIVAIASFIRAKLFTTDDSSGRAV